ncbi:MAG: hypothetical protein C0494_05800 [Sphingobium sp.]|nr:hypothetical protein [Sphingobium sp.]
MERYADLILKLERRIKVLETILARMDFYQEMIDWTAMTKTEREWAEHGLHFELHMEVWELDTQLANLDERRWGYQ